MLPSKQNGQMEVEVDLLVRLIEKEDKKAASFNPSKNVTKLQALIRENIVAKQRVSILLSERIIKVDPFSVLLLLLFSSQNPFRSFWLVSSVTSA